MGVFTFGPVIAVGAVGTIGGVSAMICRSLKYENIATLIELVTLTVCVGIALSQVYMLFNYARTAFSGYLTVKSAVVSLLA